MFIRLDFSPNLRARFVAPAVSLAAAAAIATGLLPGAALALDKPVFIELFTSQGCSSCPPADKLLAEMAHKPNVVALSLPVDYWDYIGWKDTLGKHAHTERQRAYAKVRGDGQVYTPQAVIDGVAHVVGSDAEAIRRAREECYGKSGALGVPLKVGQSETGLSVEIGQAPQGASPKAVVVLVRVKKFSEVFIGRGENKGRKLTYTNIARSAARIAEWRGQPMSLQIPRSLVESPDSDGWVLLLQAGDRKMPGAVLAAAKSPGL